MAGSHVHMHFAGNEERSWYFTPQKVETKIHKITVTCSNLTRQTLNMCECFVFSMIFHHVFFIDFSIFFKPPDYLLHTFCLLILVPALTLQKKTQFRNKHRGITANAVSRKRVPLLKNDEMPAKDVCNHEIGVHSGHKTFDSHHVKDD